MLTVRPTAVAGLFYPEDPDRLGREVDRLLEAVAVPPDEPAPKALIVPHAGYAYSGPVAASGYARLRRGGAALRRVVLMGPSHHVAFHGLALPESGAFETPLGLVEVDLEASRRLVRAVRSEAIHQREHALEVQLPFLQRVAPGVRVVPLAVGAAPPGEVAEALEALWDGPETAVVVSSDLSHYLPYRLGRTLDEATAQAILRLDPALAPDRACGAAPVAGFLEAARRRGMLAALLDLRSSGDTAGGREEVVGYGAFAFYEPAGGRS